MRDLHAALTVDPDPHAVAERGARLLADYAQQAIALRGKFTIALTGGSSPLEMYSLLAEEPYRTRIDWTRTQVFWGDERAVPPTANESNFRSAHERLLTKVPVAADHVHRMEGERDDVDAAARDYEAIVRKVIPAGPVPQLDVMLLGVGNDGHILSMHPGCKDITTPRALVVGIKNPPMNPPLSRISMTPPMLEASRAVVVLAHGAGKASALRAMLDGSDDPMKTPAHLVRRAKGTIAILADVAAHGPIKSA